MEASAHPVRNLLCPVLLFAAARAGAAIYAVGTDPGCTHETIQQAIWAAEASPEDDFIRIPHTGVWNDQSLVINDAQNLSLEGFWADCNTLDDSQQTVLDGAGGPEAPVLTVNAASGGTVSIDFLTFRNGDNAGDSSKGGGIYYRGNGALVVSNGAIINNTAGRGGGLYLEGTGTAAAVHFLGNVAITGNTAVDSGGGVFAEAVHLYMVHPNSIIAFNEATGYDLVGVTVGGYGGGLVVNDTNDLSGYATIGSAGVGNAGALYGNTARYGAGVAVLSEGQSNGGSNLFLYATQSGVPAKIEQNFAYEGGGGLYLESQQQITPSSADAFLWNASIEGNAAAEGSAIYLREVADVHFNSAWGHFGEQTPPADAVPCPLETPCGRIADNIDLDASGQPTGGAVIFSGFNFNNTVLLGAYHDAALTGPRGIVLTGNRGGHLIDMDNSTQGEGASLWASNLLIHGNEISEQLIRSKGSFEVEFKLRDSTIAGNAIGDAVLDIATDAAELQRLVIWQPGTTSLIGDATPLVESSIVSEAESLGGAPGAIVADPRFVDPAREDYGLRAASPAIDYAVPITGDDRDVFGLPRDQRIGAVPRPEGFVRDVGAFERPALLPLVLNADFAGDANLWFLPVGHSGNYQIDNAPDSPAGSGSAQVAGTNSDGRLLGYVQCIHLPGPGTYALNGWGRSEGDPALSNPTALLWEVRLDGGEGCIDGAITQSGMHGLGTQATTDQWTRPANPARITVTASGWNPNTSLTVLMAVYPNASDNGGYNGLFDGISLEWSADGSDVIFADDFDP